MRLRSATITGFRTDREVKADFDENISYIIGRNGTGKTTFARLLVAALKGDVGVLRNQSFTEIKLEFWPKAASETPYILKYARKPMAIRLSEEGSFYVELNDGSRDEAYIIPDELLTVSRYRARHIQNLSESKERAYYLEVLATDNLVSRARRSAVSAQSIGAQKEDEGRKNTITALTRIKAFFTNEIKIKWLPIDRAIQRTDDTAPGSINQKAIQIQGELIKYFAELEKTKNTEMEDFRNTCMLLLMKSEIENSLRNITPASIESFREELQEIIPELKLSPIMANQFQLEYTKLLEDLMPRNGRPKVARRQALYRLHEFVLAWRATQKNINKIFQKQHDFLSALHDAFSLNDLKEENRLAFAKSPVVAASNEIYFTPIYKTASNNMIDISSLSSGEKQFFIILAEALLERGQEEILIIDEPEISLHVSWQNRLVFDLRKMNPMAQIILATHSPDIVATSKHSLVQMESVTRIIDNV